MVFSLMPFCVIFLCLFLVLSCSGNKGVEGSSSGIPQPQSSVLSKPPPALTQIQTQNEGEKDGGNSPTNDSGKKDQGHGAADEAAYRIIME